MESFKRTKLNLDQMLDLLRCVRCENLPLNNMVYLPYKCYHKYCEKCNLKNINSKKCDVNNCDAGKKHHNTSTLDTVSVKLLNQLIDFKTRLECTTKMLDQNKMQNKSSTAKNPLIAKEESNKLIETQVGKALPPVMPIELFPSSLASKEIEQRQKKKIMTKIQKKPLKISKMTRIKESCNKKKTNNWFRNSYNSDDDFNEIPFMKTRFHQERSNISPPKLLVTSPINEKEPSLHSSLGKLELPMSESSNTILMPTNLVNIENIVKRNRKDSPLLHHEVKNGRFWKIRSLIGGGCNVMDVDGDGHTALHVAVMKENMTNNDIRIIKILCESDLNLIDTKTRNEQETALHIASRSGFEEVVSILLSFKASVDIYNNDGHLARDVAKTEKIRFMIDDFYDSTVMRKRRTSNKQLTTKYVIYFAYNAGSDMMEKVESTLNVKVSSELSASVTHIIFGPEDIDYDTYRVKLSYAYLYGIVKGCWMIIDKWMQDCLRNEVLIHPKYFEVTGCNISKRNSLADLYTKNNVPKESRLMKDRKDPGIFQGLTFIMDNLIVTGNITKDEIVQLIKVGDGNLLVENGPSLQSDLNCIQPRDPYGYFNSTSYIILMEKGQLCQSKIICKKELIYLKINWLIASICSNELLCPNEYNL